MANDINNVVIMGRVVRDPEMKYTQNGTALLTFTLASNKKEKALFIDVAVFGKFAETIKTFVSKGVQACVSGELTQSKWESDGKKMSRISITARELQVIGGKSGGGSPSEPVEQVVPNDPWQ